MNQSQFTHSQSISGTHDTGSSLHSRAVPGPPGAGLSVWERHGDISDGFIPSGAPSFAAAGRFSGAARVATGRQFRDVP